MENKVKTTEITVSRTIPASPAEIYDAWLDTKNPGGPWVGASSVTLNPTVGGLYYHNVHYQGHDWAHYGRFIVLERGRRIQQTWVSESTRGLESVLTVTLVAEGARTLVTLHQANVPDDEMGRRHAEGWGYVLAGLTERFSKKS